MSAAAQTTAQRPLCVDCKHFTTSDVKYEAFERCGHPKHGVSLVDGRPIQPSCARQRAASDRYPGACGKEGRFFEEGPAIRHASIPPWMQNGFLLALAVKAPADYGNDAIAIADNHGNTDYYFRRRICPPTWGPEMDWHPSQYRRHQLRFDSAGREWRCGTTTVFVCNDFGDLVEVAS